MAYSESGNSVLICPICGSKNLTKGMFGRVHCVNERNNQPLSPQYPDKKYHAFGQEVIPLATPQEVR